MKLPMIDSIYYDSPEDHLAAVIETKGLDEALSTLLTSYRKLFVKKGSTIITNLRLMDELKQKLLNKSMIKIRDLDEFVNIPIEILEWKEQKPPKTCLVIYGPGNTGKTELAKSVIKSMGLTPVFCRDRNSLRHESIRGDKTGIIYDDLHISDLSREEIIHIMDTENSTHMRVLYSVVEIPANVPRIFTTNDLNRVLKPRFSVDIPKEIMRRVTLVNVEKPLQLNVNINVTINNNFQTKI